MRRLGVGALVLALGGCAYYNGMYHTDRAAGRAERAERDGRTLEANGLWGEVVARAETVLVRHPDAGFADRARYLLGRGLARLGQCPRAVGPLERAADSRDPALAARAARLAGECYEDAGDPPGAVRIYGRLAESADSAERSFGRYALGRSLARDGRFDEAITALAASHHRRAPGERAAALAGAGRVAELGPLADSLLATHDTFVPWEALLARLRPHDPALATRLLEALAADPALGAATRGSLLMADAEFWLPRDSARGNARFAASEALARPGEPLARQAELRGAIARLRLATASERFRELAGQVSDLAETGGALSAEAARLGRAALKISAGLDSITPGAPNGELKLFLLAELLRDSLGAPALAAWQLRRIPAEWPASPYVPKALLALIPLDPAAGDSLRVQLAERYQANPYVLTLLGTESPGYQVLEDSLQRIAGLGRPAARPVVPRPTTPPRPQPNQPATPRAPVD